MAEQVSQARGATNVYPLIIPWISRLHEPEFEHFAPQEIRLHVCEL